jgi:GT2 family glycosyltransferase
MNKLPSPLISVVIATYNRPEGIRALLKDLDAQSGFGEAELEIVVIDDGSSTPCRSVIEARPTSLPLIFIEQANTGQGAARDKAIRAASGQIVVVLDDDMRVGPDFLAAHKRAHDAGAEVVQGAISTPPADVPIFERWHMTQLEHFANEIREQRLVFFGAALSTGNVSFRRDRYLEIGGFDATLNRSEDRDLGIRLEKAGAKLAFSHEAASVHYSDHTSLATWMDRAYRYGTADSIIARKHPEISYVDPWRFLGEVNPVSRLFLLLSVALPSVGDWISKAAMFVSTKLDQRKLIKPALAGTTLVYGMQYFRGVRLAAGSRKNAFANMRAYQKLDKKVS